MVSEWTCADVDADLPSGMRVTAPCVVAVLRCARCGAEEAHVCPASAAGNSVLGDLAQELGWTSGDEGDLCPECGEVRHG